MKKPYDYYLDQCPPWILWEWKVRILSMKLHVHFVGFDLIHSWLDLKSWPPWVLCTCECPTIWPKQIRKIAFKSREENMRKKAFIMDFFPITAKTFEFKCTFQKQKCSSFGWNDLGENFKQLIFSENILVYCKRQMNRSVKLVTKGLTQWVGLFSELPYFHK
mgnify:CR=1 FL=1